MRPIFGVVVVGLALSACGGAPSGGQAGGDAGNEEDGAAAGGAPAAGGDFCLNTVEEVSAALQVEVTTATSNENPGTGGGCLYEAEDETLVYAIAVVSGQGTADDTIAAGRESEDAVEISGIGDEAVLMSNMGPLVVRVGDTLISQGPASTDLPISDDDAALRAAMEQLARAAVGRLGQ